MPSERLFEYQNTFMGINIHLATYPYMCKMYLFVFICVEHTYYLHTCLYLHLKKKKTAFLW